MENVFFKKTCFDSHQKRCRKSFILRCFHTKLSGNSEKENSENLNLYRAYVVIYQPFFLSENRERNKADRKGDFIRKKDLLIQFLKGEILQNPSCILKGLSSIITLQNHSAIHPNLNIVDVEIVDTNRWQDISPFYLLYKIFFSF